MYTKTILVTGGAGFIGGNYLNKVVPRYPRYRFINLDALTYAAERSHLRIEKAKNYTFVKADIRDLTALKRIFKKFSPSHVVHFAAESHVDTSIARPKVFMETNVLGTFNLLECAREFHIKRFHHISTDEVYGSLKANARPADERSPISPQNPYSASKAAADHLVLAYHNTYGLDVVITRSSNNYGPGQFAEKFIPLFITAFARGGVAPLYGKGRNIRDWLFVEDCVRGIDTVFHKGKRGEVYNLGGGHEVENRVLAGILLRLVENKKARIQEVKDRPGHDLRYALNSSKAHRLGWKPKMKFEEGLLRAIHHHLHAEVIFSRQSRNSKM